MIANRRRCSENAPKSVTKPTADRTQAPKAQRVFLQDLEPRAARGVFFRTFRTGRRQEVHELQ